MTIVQISVETENDVKQYICSPTDLVSDYPTDCLAGSRMTVLNATTNLTSSDLMYDGTAWNYIHQTTVLEDVLEYKDVLDVENVFAIDLKDKTVKNVNLNLICDKYQVETATVVGTITTSGDVTVIVTADGVTDSPITLTVAVELDDTANDVAEKIRTAIDADTAIAAVYTVSGATDKIILTRKVPALTDATLNISIANDTSDGLTDDLTSTSTSVGGSNAKEITVANVPRDCKLNAYLFYNSDAVITYFDGVVFDTTPTLVSGKMYKMTFETKDGGTTWYALCNGGW